VNRLRKLLLMDAHTCPWWLGYTFDNPIRRVVYNPATILRGLAEDGQTVVDVGCGLGYFSLALARIVGDRGRVIALDVQPEMLDRARARAKRQGVDSLIDFRLCEPDRLDLRESVDFVLAFWMVHEVSNQEALLTEIRSVLKPAGHLLLVEPKVHVTAARFEKTVEVTRASGYEIAAGLQVRFSRSVVCSPSASISGEAP